MPVADEESADGASQKPTSPSGTAATAMPHRSRPTTDKLLLDQYVTRDLLHASAVYSQNMSNLDLVRSKKQEADHYAALRRERQINPAAVFGTGYAGYGNGYTDGKARVLYPCQRKRPGGRKTPDYGYRERIWRSRLNRWKN
jgi:SWI/SNF-related matrix-associated actin-dependent regulator of chromatin subfamily B protein 1